MNEIATGRRGQERKCPYEARKPQARGRSGENRSVRHDFMVELKDLIAVPNIVDRLRVPMKTDKVLGPHKDAWCEFHQAFGHRITNCLALGYLLDELVKSGFLNDYLAGSSAATALEAPVEDQAPVSTVKAPAEAVPMEETPAGEFPMGEAPAEAISGRQGREGVARAENTQDRRPEPVENVVERQIGGKTFKLGRLLSQEEQDQVAAVISRLLSHLDAFAWSASDMPDIDPDILCHHLTMDPKVCPVRQKRRKFNEERFLVMQEETKKLLSTDHIREIQYPEWLANVVLVKKANRKWRMCVDFTNLNKACPKDSYPLPSIDGLVDSASGKMLSFLDAFSGYNQIKMHPRDECKTTFMTETCCYCYKVMPFGLKNAGATYQRLMDKVLAPMLGRNVQVISV